MGDHVTSIAEQVVYLVTGERSADPALKHFRDWLAGQAQPAAQCLQVGLLHGMVRIDRQPRGQIELRSLFGACGQIRNIL